MTSTLLKERINLKKLLKNVSGIQTSIMKKIIVLSLFFLSGIVASAQYIYKIKADSVLITNDSCNAELNLENSTRNVNGFLYNKGNGRTEFRKAAIKLNDSTYVIGGDTIRLSNSGSYIRNQNSSAQSSANFWIDGTGRSNIFTSPGSGTYSEKFGLGTSANGNYTVALGYGASSNYTYGTVVGYGASTSNTLTTAIGYGASAHDYCSTVVGANAYTTGQYTVAVGYNAHAAGYGTALGNGAYAGPYAVAIGAAISSNGYSVVIGSGSSNGVVNLGFANTATTDGSSLVIGNNLVASNYDLMMGNNINGYRPLNIYLGGGKTSSLAASYGTLKYYALSGNGTDISGQGLEMYPGASTGAGTGGSFSVYTSLHGASGTSTNSYSKRLEINENGEALINTADNGDYKLQVVGGVYADVTGKTMKFTGLSTDNTATQVLAKDGSGNTVWRSISTRVSTVASSSTPTPTANTDDVYTVTALAVGATFGSPGTGAEAQELLIRIKDNGTARTLSWNAIYRAGSTVALPTTTTAGKTMYVKFVYNNTDSKWDLLSLSNGF